MHVCRLDMKLVKGSGGHPRLCYCSEAGISYLPSGVGFIKTVKGISHVFILKNFVLAICVYQTLKIITGGTHCICHFVKVVRIFAILITRFYEVILKMCTCHMWSTYDPVSQKWPNVEIFHI